MGKDRVGTGGGGTGGRGLNRIVRGEPILTPEENRAPINLGAPIATTAAPENIQGLYSLAERDEVTAKNWNGQNITIESDAKTRSSANKVFGRTVTDTELAHLSGAPDGATVRVLPNSNPKKVNLEVTHPWYDGPQKSIITREDDGSLSAHLGIFDVKKGSGAPKGLGTRAMAYSIEAGRRMGISRMTLFASGEPGGKKSGFIAWARVGFDAAMQESLALKFRRSFGDLGVTTLNQLMMANGARGDGVIKNWWARNGHAFFGTFDLDRNSRQSRVHRSYLNESGYRLYD